MGPGPCGIRKEEDEIRRQARRKAHLKLRSQCQDTDVSQKYGRPNEATPAKWNAEYKDFNAPFENGVTLPAGQIEAAKPTTVASDESLETSAAQPPKESSSKDEGDSKKRKRNEGETEEERAERKRKKKEKKEKRKSKSKKEDSGED